MYNIYVIEQLTKMKVEERITEVQHRYKEEKSKNTKNRRKE
ncbi:hypothetical protein [Thermoflavimicrobium dichotomicum]|uniref:Uncharacterized protein n=1 Tax=Thermoflavimicrobium dichotomicum TaxID=46223 RepID=A0A1I3RHZ3_9BACL|nr:hypothetical protein [Thermoflavimicrobium dichotomicum]SFJ45329.1 hypothetical protein SAMN05421852_1107 [Thermoflavimicrobium dichotomicum]